MTPMPKASSRSWRAPETEQKEPERSGMEESMTHSNTLRVLAVVFVLCLFLSGCVPAVEQPEPAPEPMTEATLPSLATAPPTEPPETTAPPTTAPPATTAPPTEPPTEPEPSPLEMELSDYVQTLDGIWNVYVLRVNTGETVHLGEQPMVAASLIKLFVAGAYLDDVAKTGEDPGLDQRMDVMLDRSDNEACNRLIDYLGYDTINNFIEENGYYNTHLGRKMLEQTDRENYTSAEDCGVMLQRVLQGEYVSQEASLRILDDLKNQQRTNKIPQGLPYGVRCANKTGELSNVENDAAIVWLDEEDPYILCVMSNDVSPYTAQQAIIHISELVYDYFTSEQNMNEQEAPAS